MILRLYSAIRNFWAPLGIPVAWRQLRQEPKRFAAALAGILFAVTMMLFQIGLRSALFSQVVSPHRQLLGDLFLVHQQYEYLGLSRTFPIQRLVQCLAHPDVAAWARLFLGNLPLKNPQTGQNRDVFVMALDPDEKVFADPTIDRQRCWLKIPGYALFDLRSHHGFGPIAQLLEANGPVVSELSGRRILIGGTFVMGTTFAADGNLIVDLSTFLHVWPGARADQPMVGLLQLRPGAVPAEVAADLRNLLPIDVKLLTRDEFIEQEITYWTERTPIGIVITASMAVALLVGAVIVYQILYTDVTDHLKEYATLKAIGYDDTYFIRLVLQESVILCVLGFLPGTALAAWLYHLTRTLAFMPVQLTWPNALLVFSLTLGMCLCAGWLATRKLRQASPADVF